MSTVNDPHHITTQTAKEPPKGARLALLIGGLISVAFGIAILFWPTKTAVALAGVIGLYAVIAGIVYVSIAILAKSLGTGGRIGHVLLGLLYIMAGVYAFTSLQQSAVFLGLFLTAMVGIMWIIEGFTSLFTLGQADSTFLTIFFAVISVIAGFMLLSSLVWGAVFLWWFLGLSLVVLGALNAIRAIFNRKK